MFKCIDVESQKLKHFVFQIIIKIPSVPPYILYFLNDLLYLQESKVDQTIRLSVLVVKSNGWFHVHFKRSK